MHEIKNNETNEFFLVTRIEAAHILVEATGCKMAIARPTIY